MTDHPHAGTVPPESSAEVAGEFLLGLVGSFYNLRVLPQGWLKLRAEEIEPRKWYPYSMLLETIRDIERFLPAETSKSLFFRAGINFLSIWYEQGPGKEMIHSGIDWFYSQTRSGGYNTVVRGKVEEIGWTEMLSIDMEKGVVVHEDVMPMHPEYVRGIYYCGCLLFDDMEFFDVTETHAPYAANPNFIRTVITTRFRLRSKDTRPDLDQCIDRLDAGEKLSLTPAEVESLIWRHKGLRFKADIDSAYYNRINALLSDAITEGERHAVELARARDAADAASRAKSAFLANMSHEIRTPMNGVLGMTELLSHTRLEVSQREQLAMLRDSGEDLLTVINDILDFSKIEAGHMELESIGFSLHDMLGRTLQALVSQAAAKKLEIELDIPDDLPDLRLGDPNRLRQVLTNLVGNAIKFTERGWVRVVITQGLGPDDFRVAVTDTGEGISPEAQAKLFQSFSQADASTTRKHGGTGLGLAISARIIEQMGGRIGVTSEPGRGSTFWFELALPPAVLEQVAGLDDRMPALSLLVGKRVLLVDDNAINRAVAGALMRRWGMEVTEAADGPAALAQVRAADYDLAVLDGAMPGMDGWQLAAAIREIPGCGEMPLVMASSSGLEASRSSAENSLFRRFLIKPLRPAQLAGALAEVLTGWQPDPAAPIPKVPCGARVLLVEDTKVNQMVACAMLEKGGHQVTLAENGVDALAKLEQPGLFDIVLMDCQMPEMDGFEATRQLRLREQEHGWPPYRVVAMTANAMESDRVACLEAGMDGYLSKPVRMEQLLKMVTGEGRNAGN